MNSVRDDHGFGIVRRPKKLLNNSHQKVRADYQTHLALQRVALRKIYKSCRVVPHELTEEQAQRKVEFVVNYFSCRKNIVKLIYLNNTDLQKQWLDTGQLPVPVAKRERFEIRSPSASGGTTNILFIMNLCQTAV
jgi:hypothetical protein